MNDNVGIDDMEVHIPKLYVDMLNEFAPKRGIDPKKLKYGIGITEMSVPDSYEDSATMAAMAILKLIERNDIDPKDIGRIYVGTETGLDHSKPNAAYILGMLESKLGRYSLKNCGALDLKFACASTSYGIHDSLNWIRTEQNRGKCGIIVATDISRYDKNTAAEYTQGAGAVAILIREKPRLMSIERPVGICTKDEPDFFRPLHKDAAVVDGKRSNKCYLEAMEEATLDYTNAATSMGFLHVKEYETVLDHIDYMLFHIPYPKMAEYASTFILRRLWKNTPIWNGIEKEIGKRPNRGDFASNKEFEKADHLHRKKLSKTMKFKEFFDSKIKKGLEFSSRIGNIYTGSLYLGAYSTLVHEISEGNDVTGKKFGFGSYGSGLTAMVFRGVVESTWKEVVKNFDLRNRLNERTVIGVESYEELHEGKRDHKNSILKPENEFALVKIGSGPLDEGYRSYEFIA